MAEHDRSGVADHKDEVGADSKERRASNRLEALRHPLRARALRVLVERGEMSPREISMALKADLSDVSHHVKRLESLDCVELTRTKPKRGALEHFYRATERHLVDTSEFDELDPVTAEFMLGDVVQRIVDDVALSHKAGMVGHDRHFHITRTPMILDEENFQKALRAAERYRAEMADIELASAEQRHESGTPGIAISSNVLLFKVPPASLDS